MDVFEPDKRSEIMRRVKSTDTKPEIVVRKMIHAMGFRFRLHRKDFPGTPDIVLPRHKKVILVHGCFWHGHDCPAGRKTPKSNIKYWNQKLQRNSLRDVENLAKLKALGWDVLILWECDIRRPEKVWRQLERFLGAYA
jgi:DNA mismatch endonuclease (patch repair protein)